MTTDQTSIHDQGISFQVEGSVAVITLNRAERLNAVNLQMERAYVEALNAADAHPAVRAVVVTGAGRGFCAGADMDILTEGRQAILDLLPDTAIMPMRALQIRKPVIVAVNGPVAGIGFAYMCCSDFRMIAAGTKMSTTFASFGLVAEFGLSWLLPRLIGLPAAIDLLFTARTIDADEALRLGLVGSIHEPEQLLPAAMALAEQLSTVSPRSLASMKRQLYQELDQPLGATLEGTLRLMRESLDSGDLTEALAARAEKRRPVFPPLS